MRIPSENFSNIPVFALSPGGKDTSVTATTGSGGSSNDGSSDGGSSSNKVSFFVGNGLRQRSLSRPRFGSSSSGSNRRDSNSSSSGDDCSSGGRRKSSLIGSISRHLDMVGIGNGQSEVEANEQQRKKQQQEAASSRVGR